jgi:hypothetical protein
MRYLFLCALAISSWGQTVLRPARVFDGETAHEGWAVRVRGDLIEAVRPAAGIDAAAVAMSASFRTARMRAKSK